MRIFTCFALIFISIPVLANSPEIFSRPSALEPAILFWTRIYTEVDTNAGLIHDQENLEVVYEIVRFDKESSSSREKQIAALKHQIRSALLNISTGKRDGLTPLEAAVLDAWPSDVSNARLRRAADNIRFQLGQANKFRAGINRSGLWRDFMRTTFSDFALPVELTALPHVESSFSPNAYSKVGAAGIWQFTRNTGRLFMRVDHVVDERMDPYRATHAAARLLKRNFELTESWPLAITAYNHGAEGMLRAKRTVGSDRIDDIIEHYEGRSFGFASRNFYAAFLAALQIDNDPHRFFHDLEIMSPLTLVTLETPAFLQAKSLAETIGVDIGTLREHNLALRDPIWNGNKLIPKGYKIYVHSESSIDASTVLAKLSKDEFHPTQRPDQSHTVQRGDTLWRISRLHNVTVNQLLSTNNLSPRQKLRLGQTLILPVSMDDSTKRVTPANSNANLGDTNKVVAMTRPRTGSNKGYRVRRGDTVISIARRFQLTPNQLKELNKLTHSRIFAGQVLIIQNEFNDKATDKTKDTVESKRTTANSMPALAKNQPL